MPCPHLVLVSPVTIRTRVRSSRRPTPAWAAVASSRTFPPPSTWVTPSAAAPRVATQGGGSGAAGSLVGWLLGGGNEKLLQGLRQPFRRQRLVTGADRCHPDADHRRRRLIDNRESSGARDPLVRQKNQPRRGYRRTARWTPRPAGSRSGRWAGPLPLLPRWLNPPHVQARWRQPATLADIEGTCGLESTAGCPPRCLSSSPVASRSAPPPHR